MTTKYKFTLKEVYLVDAKVMEKIIAEENGFDSYSIVAAEELGNYQRYEVIVTGEVDEFDMETMKEAKSMPLYLTNAYMQLLGQNKVIPMGSYIINTSW